MSFRKKLSNYYRPAAYINNPIPISELSSRTADQWSHDEKKRQSDLAKKQQQTQKLLLLLPLRMDGFIASKHGPSLAALASNFIPMGATLPQQVISVTIPGAVKSPARILGLTTNGNGVPSVLLEGSIGNLGPFQFKDPGPAPLSELGSDQKDYYSAVLFAYHMIRNLVGKIPESFQATCTQVGGAHLDVETISTIEAKLECLLYAKRETLDIKPLFIYLPLFQKYMSNTLKLIFLGDVQHNMQGLPTTMQYKYNPFTWRHSPTCVLSEDHLSETEQKLRVGYRNFLAGLYQKIMSTWIKRQLERQTSHHKNDEYIESVIDKSINDLYPYNMTVLDLEARILSMCAALQFSLKEMFNTEFMAEDIKKYSSLEIPIAIVEIVMKYQDFRLV